MAFQDKTPEQPARNLAAISERDEKRRHHKGSPPLSPEQLVDEVRRLLDMDHARQAFDLINARGSGEDVVRNARAVCCLRMGNYEQGLRLLRELVVHRGRVDLREDVPVYFKVNYATALLASGNLSGGEGVLWELAGRPHPRIAELQSAVQSTVKSLSWGRWLLWKCGYQLEQPVEIGFPPGVLS